MTFIIHNLQSFYSLIKLNLNTTSKTLKIGLILGVIGFLLELTVISFVSQLTGGTGIVFGIWTFVFYGLISGVSVGILFMKLKIVYSRKNIVTTNLIIGIFVSLGFNLFYFLSTIIAGISQISIFNISLLFSVLTIVGSLYITIISGFILLMAGILPRFR